jgi:subtilisin family serine protease
MYEDVICVGGAYPKSLNDPLDSGDWYASNIAISFSASYVDPGSTEVVVRNYPDVCGICGDLPLGNLVCAPLAPSILCLKDAYTLALGSTYSGWPIWLFDAIYSDFDGTEWNDGWAVGTGTSFATPCVAGIGCLVLSGLPDVSAMDVEGLRSALAAGCVDVRQGVSGGGHPAAQGSDMATGSGFVSLSKLFSLLGNPYLR